jgi:hypothetical protein
MRPIYCDLHNRIFRGPRTTRVCRLIVFSFCAPCWTERRGECDAHMLRMTGAGEAIGSDLDRVTGERGKRTTENCCSETPQRTTTRWGNSLPFGRTA